MRILVITVIFALLAQAAGADTPQALRRCNGPYNCITMNTGSCGSFMTNDRNGMTPGLTSLSSTNFPRIEGVCGFYSPPFYTQDRLSPPPSGTDFPAVPTYSNPP